MLDVRDNEILGVEATKKALEDMEGKSITQALLPRHSQEVVEQMDDEKKAEHYKKMQSQLHREHVLQAKVGADRLLHYSTLPPLHQKVYERKLELEGLRKEADLVTSKDADCLHADLQQQQATVQEKKLKCSGLRRVTIREEMTKRGLLLEAWEVYQKALAEYRVAYLRNEASAIVEAGQTLVTFGDLG